jgi:uncharacterized membrane protein
MEYTSEIEIDSPVAKVIELFDNPDNLDKWMKRLQSFESISGKPVQVGAKSILKSSLMLFLTIGQNMYPNRNFSLKV